MKIYFILSQQSMKAPKSNSKLVNLNIETWKFSTLKFVYSLVLSLPKVFADKFDVWS